MKAIINSLILLLVVMLASCSSSKQAQSEQQEGFSRIDMPKSAINRQMEFENYYFDGAKQGMLKNYDKAAESFSKALKVNPNSAAALYEYAKAEYNLYKFDNAEQAVRKAIKLESDNKWFYILLGNILEYNKKHLEAAQVYEKLITLVPNDLNLYESLATLYTKAGKLDLALKTYQRMENKFGVSPDITLAEQKIYLKQNKVAKAAEQAQKLINAYPDEMAYYKNLGDIYEVNGFPDKALKVYQDMYSQDSASGLAQLSLAEYYRKQGNKKLENKYLYQAFANPDVDIDHKIAIIYSSYLTGSSADSNLNKAFPLTRILVKTYPTDSKAHALYGDLLYQAKKYKDARDQYKESIKLDKDNYDVWQQLFIIESQLGNFDSMLTESNEALTYFPNQPEIYFFNGIANLQLKEYKDALKTFKNGLDLNIQNQGLASQFYTNMAEANYRLQQYQDSYNDFDSAIKLDPTNAVALNNYAYYLSKQNTRLQDALEMSQKSLKISPDEASYLDTYGWILYKMQKYDEAKKYIEKSLQIDKNNGDVLEHYGDVLFKLGDSDKAVEYWQKAKANGDPSKLLDKKIKEKRLYE